MVVVVIEVATGVAVIPVVVAAVRVAMMVQAMVMEELITVVWRCCRWYR